jgi:ribose-phosphate pyrophosphokinase
MASMIAELMQLVGVSHVLALDLHAPQIEGFFHIPVDSLSAVPTLLAAVQSELPTDTVVVSPDEGRFKIATEFARCLRRRVAVLQKHRESGTATSVVRVVGDVQGQACLIIDDIISTGGTIAESVEALVRAGARPEIFVAATHGIFANGARERLNDPAIRKIFIGDSVPLHDANWPALNIVSFAPLFAAAVRRLRDNESLGTLYSRVIGPASRPNISIVTRKGDCEHEPAIP